MAFGCRTTFVLDNPQYEDNDNILTPENFMNKFKNDIIDLIAKCLDQHDAICVNLELFCDGEIPTKDEKGPIGLDLCDFILLCGQFR